MELFSKKFILINPETFHITPFQQKQNLYLDHIRPVNKAVARRQHAALVKALPNAYVANIGSPTTVPDIIFAANWALTLPRLPKPTVILSSMKYAQRKREQPYIHRILTDLDIICLPPLPCIFEGQAELKWFHGGMLAIHGYGFRSTKNSGPILRSTMKKIYGSYGLPAPHILSVEQICPALYHLDLCILEVDAHRCIVQKKAFSPSSLSAIQRFLGPSNVLVIDSEDEFICNSIVTDTHILVNASKDSDTKIYSQIEDFTKKPIISINTSEFNKSGGGIRCMVLALAF